jgi:hypothetical protein
MCPLWLDESLRLEVPHAVMRVETTIMAHVRTAFDVTPTSLLALRFQILILAVVWDDLGYIAKRIFTGDANNDSRQTSNCSTDTATRLRRCPHVV